VCANKISNRILNLKHIKQHDMGRAILRVFKDDISRRIFEPKRDELTEEWRKLHSGSFIICAHRQILLGR
jgi:hypothetical protein